MSPEEEKQLREQLADAQKRLSETLPGMEKLNGIISAFQNDPQLKDIGKTVDDLKKTEQSLTEVFKRLSGLDKETLDKLSRPS